ncbi:hypothetical protein C8Q79DRAFT_95693 [Trametes meyenii]|nr:hypothetical protein C8Q79DRAFT_95693 [Trametes meyenii]
MLSLLSPILSTPLLKIPILIPDAVLTYISLTPPNPPPPRDERKRFADPDMLSDTFRLQIVLIKFCKAALIGLMASEASTILAQSFPSPLSERVLSLLAPTPLPLAPTPRFLLSGALVVAAGFVRAWTYRTLGKFFRWQLSVQDDHKLVTSGPYAWVRHPSYMSAAFLIYGNLAGVLWGPGTYFTEAGLGRTAGGRVVAGAIAAYLMFLHAQLIVGRVDKEDEVLRERFGEEWERWARKTPYKLIPYVY